MSDQAAPPEVTRLLAAWSAGDATALEKVTQLVYQELKRLAHQAYLRLASHEEPSFANRTHFLAVAAKAMRQILVDHAKASLRQKRGAGVKAVELDEIASLSPEPTREIIDLNEALEKLAALDVRKAQVVELKYFGGLKSEEIAEVLKVSEVTVRRDWTFAKAWLYAELRPAD
jgi:RNA polymerase sigma factor (TIGR02999 family)